MLDQVKPFIINSVKPYASLLFLDSKVAGGLILIVTFLNPSVAISGLSAVLCTILFAKFLQFKEAYTTHGFYIYNSLLTGMGIGYIFTPSLTSMALIAIASVFTFMLSFMINRLFSTYKIPILSLPFSIMTIFVYLASLKYSTLLTTLVNHHAIYDISLPESIAAYFQAMGTIFFLPHTLAGLLISFVVLYFSRIIFIMSVVGFYFGILIHYFFIGSFQQALHDPYAFNYILVSIALCGIFLLPTIQNFFIALMGVSISVLLTDAIHILFHYYTIPVFTLPFNITVITFIFIFSILHYKEFNLHIQSTPEASLAYYLNHIFRFGDQPIKIALPFSGDWSVYQGFHDEWTHKAEYGYAYDFVKKEGSKSYQNSGVSLEEYFAYGESILSPVSGYVIDFRDDLPDNPIGEVDRLHNWGNYIIIKSDFGFFVEISHLMQYSISVKTGDYIQIHDIIAKCGNSGYSPEPHIHIQVQETSLIGGFTKAFVFSEYIHDQHLHFHQLPQKGETVTSVIHNRSVYSRFLFILDDTFDYLVFQDNTYVESVQFKVKMNHLGEFYLSDKDHNQLYFYNDGKQFYFYKYLGTASYLKWLFILAPRFPFIQKERVYFKDALPINLFKSKFQTMIYELISTVHKRFATKEIEYKLEKERLHSTYGFVSLDLHKKGFHTIQYNNITLRSQS